MKKMLFIVFIILVASICDTVQAKSTNFYSYYDNYKNSPCYVKSNYDYKSCMGNCISDQSPDYIMQLCFSKCAKMANNRFFHCLLKNKYNERIE